MLCNLRVDRDVIGVTLLERNIWDAGNRNFTAFPSLVLLIVTYEVFKLENVTSKFVCTSRNDIRKKYTMNINY